MLPESIPDHREWVSNVNKVLTLLRPTQVYLLALAPENDVWPAERVMLVWKTEAGAWQFKMLLLGEQHQDAFDVAIDGVIIQGLNALEINPDASENISDTLGEDLLARINRPCLRLSFSQQIQIIGPVDLAWPLMCGISSEANIQVCLALLTNQRANLSDEVAEQVNAFQSYLTLDTINVLVGHADARIYEFRATNNQVTLGDILRFIQLLLSVSAKKLGHGEVIVLPGPPAGSERLYGDRPAHLVHDVYQLPILDVLPLPDFIDNLWIRLDMEAAGMFFENALINLDESVPNLLNQDAMDVHQSLSALREAKRVWFASLRGEENLLTFRRTTDEILRADHIQRLYTHQRFGLFCGCYASEALTELRLSLRHLRDVSLSRRSYIDHRARFSRLNLDHHEQNITIDVMIAILVNMIASKTMLEAFFIPFLTTLGVANFYIGCWFSYMLILSDLNWNKLIMLAETFREGFTVDLPLVLSASVVVGVCFAVCLGLFGLVELTGVEVLATALLFLSFSSTLILLPPLLTFLFLVTAAASQTGYNMALQLNGMMLAAISEIIEDISYGFSRVAPEDVPEVIPMLPQETGLMLV